MYKLLSEYQSVRNRHFHITVEKLKDTNLNWLKVFNMLYIILYLHSQMA